MDHWLSHCSAGVSNYPYPVFQAIPLATLSIFLNLLAFVIIWLVLCCVPWVCKYSQKSELLLGWPCYTYVCIINWNLVTFWILVVFFFFFLKKLLQFYCTFFFWKFKLVMRMNFLFSLAFCIYLPTNEINTLVKRKNLVPFK